MMTTNMTAELPRNRCLHCGRADHAASAHVHDPAGIAAADRTRADLWLEIGERLDEAEGDVEQTFDVLEDIRALVLCEAHLGTPAALPIFARVAPLTRAFMAARHAPESGVRPYLLHA